MWQSLVSTLVKLVKYLIQAGPPLSRGSAVWTWEANELHWPGLGNSWPPRPHQHWCNLRNRAYLHQPVWCAAMRNRSKCTGPSHHHVQAAAHHRHCTPLLNVVCLTGWCRLDAQLGVAFEITPVLTRKPCLAASACMVRQWKREKCSGDHKPLLTLHAGGKN